MLKSYTRFFESRKNIFNDTDGATAIEYGLIAAGIAIAIIAVIFTLGEDISVLFSGISEQVSQSANK